MKKKIFIFIILVSFFDVFSQTDTLVFGTKNKHSIRNAVLFSVFLPGAGQIYNDIGKKYYNQFKVKKHKQKISSWWKIPIIYAGLGVSAYFIYENNRQVNRFRREYNYRIENNNFLEKNLEKYDNQALLTVHDQYQTWRDLSILSLCIVYILNIVDAGVDAHFVNFNISEDLSMNILPNYNLIQNSFGVGLRFNLK